MKQVTQPKEPANVIVGKDRARNLFIAFFDSQQVTPRVTVGSAWLAHDRRYGRKYLMRVVETAYNDDFDLKQILSSVRESPSQPFDYRSIEYYCAEKAWLRVEGEFTASGMVEVYDQPTILQTFLRPTTASEDLITAMPDTKEGFAVGFLRSGAKVLKPIVTLEDRFVGHRTLITGASGFGKSTFVRNIARRWLENTGYGKVIDDLKGEYVTDIKNERGETVLGLCHHPKSKHNLYLLTPHVTKYQGTGLEQNIAGVIPMQFSIDDIPPTSLKDVATHISEPQSLFLEMYQDKPGLFKLLLRETSDGSPDTSDWHRQFKGFVVLTKQAENDLAKDPNYMPSSTDFKHTYTPIHSIIRQLTRLIKRPFMVESGQSCLPKLRELLATGATVILDKSALTDEDRMIISTVLADHLYRFNEKHSSGNQEAQAKVIRFVYLVEEAHLLLSSDRAKEGSVFVNFAKTGRSFQIGLMAVTQRPSSVDTNILSQFDNFITFRLSNEQDVRDLVKAKSEFRGYESDISSMRQGAALTAFGEPTKVQPVQGFEWDKKRAMTLLSQEQQSLLDDMLATVDNSKEERSTNGGQ